MKIKCHIGLEIMFGTICYHIGMHLSIVPSVHRQKKSGIWNRFDVAPSVGESQLPPLDPAEEQRLRSRCWVVAAGPKHKGRLYGTGDLAHTYKCGNDIFMKHTKGSSCHTEDAAEINRLKEELCQSKGEMHVFQSVVLQFLLPEARNIIHQQQQPHQQHQD